MNKSADKNKFSDFPKIDLKRLNLEKEKNFKQRLEFIDKHVEYIKKNSNKKWSSEQKKIINL
jgi:hypothetical protein